MATSGSMSSTLTAATTLQSTPASGLSVATWVGVVSGILGVIGAIIACCVCLFGSYHRGLRWRRFRGARRHHSWSEKDVTEKGTLLTALTGISENDLQKISEKLGPDWEALAANLGLPQTQVDHIKRDYPDQTQDQIFSMLIQWRRRQSNSTQRAVLQTALEEVGRVDIVKDLEENTGYQGLCTFKDLQQQIRDNYKQTATTLPAHPIMESRHAGIDEFFIPLYLTKDIPGKTESDKLVNLPEGNTFLDVSQKISLNSTEDLLNPEIVKESKVLVSGEAGSGKSTLVVKIANSCLMFGTERLFGRFDLVLWIKLRQMLKSSCVLDALFDQILAQNTNLTKPKVKQFIDYHESRIAWLLDGFDEIPSKVLESKDGVYRVQDILDNKVLRKSFVLVTTHPEKQSSFTGPHAKIDILGFTQQDRDRFIRLSLCDEADKGDSLISHLNQDENLQEMSKLPIISQMLCLLCKNQKKLPDSVTKLYGEFAEVFYERCFKDMRLKSNMKSTIDGLGSVGLKGSLEGRTVFDETEFEDFQSCLDEGCCVGFVQHETYSSDPSEKVLISFLHKSIQEHFAACHLVKLLDNDESSFCRQLQQIGQNNVLAMELLLQFSCGRSAQAAGLILDHIQEMQGDEEKLQRLARLLLFESGSGELAAKLVRPTCVFCSRNKHLKFLSFYLQYVTPPLEAELFHLDVRKQMLPLLREILASNNMRLTVGIVVNYHLSEQEKEELSHLQTTLDEVEEQRHSQLYIVVWIGPESWFDVGRVSLSLSCICEQIGRVEVGMDRRSPEEVVHLVKALEGCRLRGLSLHETNLHALLCDLSPISSSLGTLELCACRLVDDDMMDLFSIIPAGHGLEKLNLSGNTFRLNAVRALTHHLQRVPGLGQLRLCNISLDANLITQVVSQDLPHLKETEEGVFISALTKS